MKAGASDAGSAPAPPSRRARASKWLAASGIVALSLAAVAPLAKRHAPPPAPRAFTGLELAFVFGSSSPPAPAIAVSPEPIYPFLEGERADESISVGDTSSGRVVNARAVSESDSLAILPKQRERDLRYGSAEMIDLLEGAGRDLFAATHTRLFLGNIGKRGGGDIPFSVSHNAGRDADVALSYLDASGKAIDPPDLVPIGRDGTSKDGRLKLDVKRTWLTVKGLVEHPGVSIEYVFVSEPIKSRVLKYARGAAEKPSIIERAANVMRQPVGAAPHDDHLHVRIYCGDRDLAGGCVDTGDLPPARASAVSLVHDRVTRATAGLSAKDPLVRARSVVRLALLGEHPAQLTALLDDPSPNVRHAVATAIARLHREADCDDLARRLPREDDGTVAERIVLAAAVLGGKCGGETVSAALQLPERAPDVATATVPAPTPAPDSAADFEVGFPLSVDLLDGASLRIPLEPRAPTLQRYAIAVAAHADRLEPVPALIELLVSHDAHVRASAAESLALVTNHRFEGAFTDDTAGKQHDSARSRYADLLKKLAKSPRDVWVAAGFVAAGFKVRAFDKSNAWELVRATAGDAHTSYNAREILARIADDSRVSVAWPASDACSYYLRLFRGNRFRLQKPPTLVEKACAALKKT